MYLGVDVRLPGKGNSNSHGARPVHLIITMIKWIRTSRLSINNSLSVSWGFRADSIRTHGEAQRGERRERREKQRERERERESESERCSLHVINIRPEAGSSRTWSSKHVAVTKAHLQCQTPPSHPAEYVK